MAETVDQKRHDALANRDAAKYFRYCNELGVEPEAPELYERGKLDVEGIPRKETGLAKIVAISPEGPKGKTTSSRRRKFDYVGFREAVEKAGFYQALNPFVNIGPKGALLKEFGVDTVRVVGRTIPIEEAEGTILGAVFQDRYERSLRIA